jgi:hypothetical protein
MTLAIVTATLDGKRCHDTAAMWIATATQPHRLYVVLQGQRAADWTPYSPGLSGWQIKGLRRAEILGVVPAFALGVQKALEDGADVIACLHDDLEITGFGWDLQVERWFEDHPKCGLLGFGGGTGLGDADIYQTPYNPMQLARKQFGSNMRDAEAHGERWTEPRRVACLDGFSQIGRAEFWAGLSPGGFLYKGDRDRWFGTDNLFARLRTAGVIHHMYDGALGAFAAKYGWETWFLPIACHHHGGLTAVGDPRYAEWAKTQHPDGDAGFWQQSHRAVYEMFRGVLPIRVTE